MQKLEREERQATAAEQAVLARYVGWGASEMAQNLFSDKLDAKLAAIERWDSAMADMDERGRDTLQRGQSGHWQAAALLAESEGKEPYDYAYHTITRAQLKAVKPDGSAKSWGELRTQLRGLLSEEEWAAASRSTQNAH